jgi:hypothetical protein
MGCKTHREFPRDRLAILNRTVLVFSQGNSAPSTELTDFQTLSIRRKPVRYQAADNSIL